MGREKTMKLTARGGKKKNETDGTRLRRGRQFRFFSAAAVSLIVFSRPIVDGFIILCHF